METEEVVEKVIGGVVNINVEKIILDRYYNMEEMKGSGSGFIVSKNIIVTNNHVILNSDYVNVTTSDGRNFTGRFIDSDPTLDIAFIYVEDLDIEPLILGDSDKIKVGQIVLAIGNPLGILGSPTVTMGIVSAIKRSIKSEIGVFEDLIQTDAAINPGNSGGPLVNMKGEVIGITSAMIPFAQGIGFAIPINNVKKLLDSLRNYGRIVKPYLGIYGITINDSISNYYSLPVKNGVLITDVSINSPAYHAGLRRGDIITGINDKNLDGIDHLKYILESEGPGKIVELEIIRKGKRFKIEIELGSIE